MSRPVGASKARLRQTARATRDALPGDQRRESQRAIALAVLALPEVERAQVVFVYASYGSEVGTLGLIQRLIERGKTVLVPRIAPRGAMLPTPITSNQALQPDERGIPTPPAGEAYTDTPDVVLLPGLAFTLAGDRLGQGGGYYDRYLAEHATVPTAGLAFEAQIVDALPLEPHDRPVDYVITSAGVVGGLRG